jgi:hypothetical protein
MKTTIAYFKLETLWQIASCWKSQVRQIFHGVDGNKYSRCVTELLFFLLKEFRVDIFEDRWMPKDCPKRSRLHSAHSAADNALSFLLDGFCQY